LNIHLVKAHTCVFQTQVSTSV